MLVVLALPVGYFALLNCSESFIHVGIVCCSWVAPHVFLWRVIKKYLNWLSPNPSLFVCRRTPARFYSPSDPPLWSLWITGSVQPPNHRVKLSNQRANQRAWHNTSWLSRASFTELRAAGAVCKSRWPSWVLRPNEPHGFRGRKAILNHDHVLVSACP